MNIVYCATGEGRYRLEGGGGGVFEGSGEPAHLGIRPEHISVCAPDQGQCAGHVDVIEDLGADTFLLVDCGPLGALTVRITGDARFDHGASVSLTFAGENCHFFDRSGHRLDA